MKWKTENHKGEEQIWYSGDVIELIKQTCYNFGLIHHTNNFGQIIASEANPLATKIIRIIENEDA